MPDLLSGENPQQTEQDDPVSARTGNCLLLQIGERRMLVPRNAVAEVIRYSFLAFSVDSYTGLMSFEWRGRQVPLVDSELAGAEAEAEPDEDSKVVILHALKKPQQLPFYSFVVSGSPQLLRVSDEQLLEVTGAPLHQAELMRVSLHGQEAYIPRIDYFENTLLGLIRHSAGN